MTQLKEDTLSELEPPEVKRREKNALKKKLRSVSHIEQSVDDCEAGANSKPGTSGNDGDDLKKKGIRPSKSDTSLTESFVMVDGEGGEGKRKMSNKQNVLRFGMLYIFRNVTNYVKYLIYVTSS